jgi:DNA-binding MarR family transcriptional regulator
MAIAQGPAETAELMFSCFKRMRRLVDSELGECGLSLSRSKLLSELGRNGSLQQSALAATFGLAPRTVTELVDTLERDGLVERRPDPTDRRARQVQLTPTGEQARARAIAIREQIIDRLLGGLSDEQLTGLRTTLHRIEAEIDKIDADHGSTDGDSALTIAGTDPICGP